MNRTDLIAAVAKETGNTQAVVEAVIKASEGKIAEALIAGENVQLVGFGTFKSTPKEATTARNPKTGEEVAVAATNRVTFSVSDALKERLKK
ncbi:DNA-binding protein HU-beta [Acinetobacter phage SH-Ab 15599]|nr:DNA-binding protein HU-beta [Acinetobacter phage SH-Ab 15599]